MPTVTVQAWKCSKCRKVWLADEKPQRCSRCKSRQWDVQLETGMIEKLTEKVVEIQKSETEPNPYGLPAKFKTFFKT